MSGAAQRFVPVLPVLVSLVPGHLGTLRAFADSEEPASWRWKFGVLSFTILTVAEGEGSVRFLHQELTWPGGGGGMEGGEC